VRVDRTIFQIRIGWIDSVKIQLKISAGSTLTPFRLRAGFTTQPTYLETKEGWLYLAVILDLFSRTIVGWSMQKRMTKALVMEAWKMACAWRHPPKQMLHHSDLGSQYTSKAYLDLLREKNCLISMSEKGNCYDNACVESFFSTLKGECAVGVFESRTEAKTSIFEYIEVWYNRKRLHSTLGYLSPLEFEIRQAVSTKL
jgi:putative transposase